MIIEVAGVRAFVVVETLSAADRFYALWCFEEREEPCKVMLGRDLAVLGADVQRLPVHPFSELGQAIAEALGKLPDGQAELTRAHHFKRT